MVYDKGSVQEINPRLALFELYVSAPNLPPENTIDAFRDICFDGIPDKYRAKSWKLLAQQIPFDNRKSWSSTLEGLRNTYYSFFDQFCVEPNQRDLKILQEGYKMVRIGDEKAKQIMADMELLDQIDKDIRRTFSDIAFFQQAVNQNEACKIYHDCNISKRNSLATWLRNYYTFQEDTARRKSVSNTPNDFHWECMQRLLYIYAKVNPGLGYVQGMNYLLAPIYYVTAIDPDKSDSVHAEADAFFLFNALMSHFRDMFTRSMDDINFNTNPDLKKVVELSSDGEIYAEGNGVGHTMERFQSYLKAVDETIFNDFSHLLKVLVIDKEFSLPDALRIWDSLFAELFSIYQDQEDSAIDFLIEFSVAMILAKITVEMCDAQEEMIPKAKNNRSLKEGFCYKCKAQKPDLHVRNSDFCKSCFLDSTIHRFRNNLMKIKAGNVLVALSGGPSSMCLLDLMSNFNSVDPVNKRQPKYPNVHVCHVDVSLAVPQIEPDLVDRLKEDVERREFKFTSIRLEGLFADSCSVAVKDQVPVLTTESDNESPADRLKNSLESVSSLSSREDLLNIYIKKSILTQAIKNNCNIILFGDNSTLLAVKTISLSAKGRGVVLADEIALEHVITVNERKFSLVRPLRDVLGKEVSFYNQFKGLSPFNNANLTTGLKKDCSIDRMTSDFIIGLDDEFPSTVSTIARTAFKIKAKEHSTLSCSLCEAPLDEVSKFSEIMGDAAENATPEAGRVPINQVLCYACRNISRDMKKTIEKRGLAGTLPGSVSRQAMKEQIQEFLIE
ncbi:hypothetical protein HDV01_000974 [Terramyces sp. JEL0728]|nr:hypothetical protein HDV01_000974 [Terramyces sp. JEL0728]